MIQWLPACFFGRKGQPPCARADGTLPRIIVNSNFQLQISGRFRAQASRRMSILLYAVSSKALWACQLPSLMARSARVSRLRTIRDATAAKIRARSPASSARAACAAAACSGKMPRRNSCIQ